MADCEWDLPPSSPSLLFYFYFCMCLCVWTEVNTKYVSQGISVWHSRCAPLGLDFILEIRRGSLRLHGKLFTD